MLVIINMSNGVASYSHPIARKYIHIPHPISFRSHAPHLTKRFESTNISPIAPNHVHMGARESQKSRSPDPSFLLRSSISTLEVMGLSIG